MARKKKEVEGTYSQTVVRDVPIESARVLVTFEPTSIVWTDQVGGLAPMVKAGTVSGALVRVRPPVDVAEGKVESLRAELLRLGASSVRIVPGGKRDEVPVEAAAAVPSESMTSAIDRLVRESPCEYRAELTALVDRIKGEAGI